MRVLSSTFRLFKLEHYCMALHVLATQSLDQGRAGEENRVSDVVCDNPSGSRKAYISPWLPLPLKREGALGDG